MTQSLTSYQVWSFTSPQGNTSRRPRQKQPMRVSAVSLSLAAWQGWGTKSSSIGNSWKRPRLNTHVILSVSTPKKPQKTSTWASVMPLRAHCEQAEDENVQITSTSNLYLINLWNYYDVIEIRRRDLKVKQKLLRLLKKENIDNSMTIILKAFKVEHL